MGGLPLQPHNGVKKHKRLLHGICAAAFLAVWDDLECPPRCFGHLQRKNYFIFRVCRALRGAPNAFSQKELFPVVTFSVKKVVQKRPQTFLNHDHKTKIP